MNLYQGLGSYLGMLTTTYNFSICFKDYVGFLDSDPNLYSIMQPYLIHKSPYCMYIKSDQELWHRCREVDKRIFKKASKKLQTFYGVCYCGMGEYIVPIIHDKYVIGTICVGGFCPDKRISDYLIKKTSNNHCISLEMMTSNFTYSVLENTYDIKFIDGIFGIVSEHLSMIYAKTSASKNILIDKNRDRSSERYIVSHAIEYIKQNYQQRITVEEICGFCHCSKWYLSRNFKKINGININNFVNKIRVEAAKLHLINSETKIADIATNVGFDDPNYFTSIFTKHCGISPTAFRKKRTINKQHNS